MLPLCVYEYVFILYCLSYGIEHLPSQKALLLLSLDEHGTFLDPLSRSAKSSIFCMSLICLIYDANVTDHDDTSVRRGVRPGVTAVQLRLHPLVDPELSV